MIKAVIFDLDGTLIDTEKYYRIFWPKALEAFGYHMTDEQALALRSLGRPFAPKQMKEWFGESLDYYAVRQKRRDLMESFLDENGVERKPGAREILDYLRGKNIITAIATATDLERTDKYLKKLGLDGCFDRIISATQVKNGKPAPDIYAFACNELKCKPADCLAVEDSPNGVLSAYRAGCRVIMVPDQTQPDEELSKCLYAKLENLLGLEELIEGEDNHTLKI